MSRQVVRRLSFSSANTKKDMAWFYLACAVATLALVSLFLVLEGCKGIGPTPTTSPISPPSTPQAVEQQELRAAAAAGWTYTATSYLNWDDPAVTDGWVTVWADADLAYKFVHNWRVKGSGGTIIAQGTTTNTLAASLPTGGPGAGRFDGPLIWRIPLAFFSGQATLWERGCWEPVTCPLTATVVLSYPTHMEDAVTGCPDACWVNSPGLGVPLAQDVDGYWLTAYITGTGTLPYRKYLPLVIGK